MRSLIRRQRIALTDRQITAHGPSGQGGVYAVLYQDDNNRGSVDVRFFKHTGVKHHSTQYGVILASQAELRGLLQALTEIEQEWTKFKLLDAEVAGAPQ